MNSVGIFISEITWLMELILLAEIVRLSWPIVVPGPIIAPKRGDGGTTLRNIHETII